MSCQDHLIRFVSLFEKSSLSHASRSHMEFLLYQMSLVLLKHERNRGNGTACQNGLAALEPLNRLMQERELELDLAAQSDIDIRIMNGLARIVADLGGEGQCSRSNSQKLQRSLH